MKVYWDYKNFNIDYFSKSLDGYLKSHITYGYLYFRKNLNF